MVSTIRSCPRYTLGRSKTASRRSSAGWTSKTSRPPGLLQSAADDFFSPERNPGPAAAFFQWLRTIFIGQHSAGYISEGHAKAQRRPAAGITALEHTGHVVAYRKQAGHQAPIAAHHARPRIRLHAGKVADVARVHPNRVVRRFIDRRHAWIGRVAHVAEEAPVGVPALAERRVFAGGRVPVEIAQRLHECKRIDARCTGEFLGRVGPDQIASINKSL